LNYHRDAAVKNKETAEKLCKMATNTTEHWRETQSGDSTPKECVIDYCYFIQKKTGTFSTEHTFREFSAKRLHSPSPWNPTK